MKKIKILLVILGLVFISSCIREKEYFVEYRVYGGYDYTYDVEYKNPQGGVDYITGCVGNWNYTFTTHNPDFHAWVDGRLNGYGTIRVEILVNGYKIKTSESHGSYPIASADCSVKDKPERGF